MFTGEEFVLRIEAKLFFCSESDKLERRWGRVLNCHDHDFVFTVVKERKKSDDVLYARISAALQFIGSKIEANN